MFKRHKVYFLAAAVYLLIVLALLSLSVNKNSGHIIYALDDPYIHMAIAKNLAEYGVWGMNCNGYVSCSSSPLYTLILGGAFFLFGPGESIPLIINVVAGLAAILAAYGILIRFYTRTKLIFIFLLLIIFISPLYAVTFIGMEHTMHLALSLLFVYLAAGEISAEGGGKGSIVPVLATAPLIMSLRYESVFLLLAVSVLMATRKRFRDAAIIMIVGLVPVAIYGLVSLYKGGNFIPNPILLKGNVPYFSFWGAIWWGIRVYGNLSSPHVILLLVASLAAYLYLSRTEQSFWNEKQIALVIFITATIFHMVFASTEWFFRYDAYLVGIGLTAVLTGFSGLFGGNASLRNILGSRRGKTDILVTALIVAITVTPFIYRAASLMMIPQATANIYQQHYQMGLFFSRYYSGEVVAANDTGVVSFLSDSEVVDLWGLGSDRVLRAKKAGSYNKRWIDDFTRERNVKVAVVYESWFSNYGGLPSGWVKVCRWTIPHEIVCGAPTVTFYAVAGEEERLRENLEEFSADMPPEVKVSVLE